MPGWAALLELWTHDLCCVSIVTINTIYVAVGRKVQLSLDRSRGGHSAVHQVRELQQDTGGDKVKQNGLFLDLCSTDHTPHLM